MRTLTLVLLLAGFAMAGDKPQIEWVGDWDAAFKLAKKSGKPVMVCINSKDGESANETTATTIYRHPLFVALTRKFVMVLISTREHSATGPCPRFGGVTCDQHLDCWKSLSAHHGDVFNTPGTNGAQISPQHAWFSPDGALLRRKEYFLSQKDLTTRMRAVLAETKKARKAGGDDGTRMAGKSDPLDGKDTAALERLKNASDKEARTAALGTLLGADKTAVYVALLELLRTTKNKGLKRDLLRVLAREKTPDIRGAAEEHLTNKDAETRSSAAVALEYLAEKESVPALLKRVKKERDAVARKNVCRALGACAGPIADKAAAKALLRAMASDKDPVVAKHAGLALHHFAGEGSKLVLKRLERSLLKTKNEDVVRAIVYTLAFVGNTESTVKALHKLDEETAEEWNKRHIHAAIAKLKATPEEQKKFAKYGDWLYWEDREDPARKG